MDIKITGRRGSQLLENIIVYMDGHAGGADIEELMSRLDAIQTELHRTLIENGIEPPVRRFYWENNPYLPENLDTDPVEAG